MAEQLSLDQKQSMARGEFPADKPTGSRSMHAVSERVKFFEERPPIPRRAAPASPISVLGARRKVEQADDSMTALAGSPMSVTDASNSSDDTPLSPLSNWVIPRWTLLEEKRLALCRQRVQLERRLFESVLQHDSRAELPEPRNFRINEEPVLWSGSVDEVTGLPTGYGRMVFKDGQVYKGHCKAGLRNGQGCNVWSNQQVYTGEWVQGQREGRGTHTWPDGRTVTGAWIEGHLHGRVFFSWPDGASYDGDTVRGQKQGRGTQTWNDGRVYAGQYWAGYEHGVGMLTEVNQNSKYRGQFKQGSRHGYGIQIWATKTYDGEWLDNMVHGRGKLLWRETGACYTGQFRFGRYHGIGCYSDGGKKYVGHWRDGVKEGEGKSYWPDGRVYEGSFRQNKRHGYGRMAYADGAMYTGGWKHGKRSGRGIEIAADGIVRHCGSWLHDEPIGGEMETETATTTTDDLIVTKLKAIDDGEDPLISRDPSDDDSSDTSRDADLRQGLCEC